MRTIATANQKGGAGKTTGAVNLAACLAAVGPRALLAATLACLLTAAVAGVFFHESLSVAVARGVSTVPAAP